jgi:hypothetical protein|tara:strand:+ start:10865 stop:11116 length:252 start_codon:yes stop_codon:yes gene_type:complete
MTKKKEAAEEAAETIEEVVEEAPEEVAEVVEEAPEEVAEVVEEAPEEAEGPELEPGQYVREVNGVKYLAYKDDAGVTYDLRKL